MRLMQHREMNTPSLSFHPTPPWRTAWNIYILSPTRKATMKQNYTRITTVLFNYCTITGVLLFITCCATPPPMLEEPVKRYWEVAEPLETVWKATVQSLVDKGVIISILDQEDHLIV